METYCILCREPIPLKRSVRRAVTCSETCAKEYRRQARQDRAEKKCRLCGRRFRKARFLESTLEKSDAKASDAVTIAPRACAP